ncbi:MAG: hypothetical protein LBV55_02130 [Acholeplasmatales bacterium]|jgi:hypothetical protein|nr:hypothetical protein [Acholeplasmatales bacterium]
MLFKIFGIEITLTTLFSFVFGLLMGLVIFFLIYLYAMIKSLNKAKKRKLVTEEDIDYLEIEKLIKSYQDEHQKQKKEMGFVKSLLSVNKNLAFDIASLYFPKSKYPYGEITIDEAFEVAHYVIKRLDELLSAKIVRLFRKYTISRLISISITSKKINDSKTVEGAKVLSKGVSSIKKAINIINPVYWVKKAFVDSAIKITLNKIGLVVICIVGEECYKIYAKRPLMESSTNEEHQIDDIYQELKEINEKKSN